MNSNILNESQFHQLFLNLKLEGRFNEEVLFVAYQSAYQSAELLNEKKLVEKYMPVNHIELILYLVSEIDYFQKVKKQQISDVNQKELQIVVSMALDKYLTNEHYSFKNELGITKYSPVISTLDLYLNFVLQTMDSFPNNIPQKTLIIDILKKALLMAKAIVDLIVRGFETEAFATWRTLHESECILVLLTSYGKNLYLTYLKHLKYALAYRGAIIDKNKTDEVFLEIKEEMKKHELKSKDMKKFIEYGWLYEIDPTSRLNFRDGVQRLSKLESYSSTYELASEIAHSSPILIYSKSTYFLHNGLLNLYESLFRLDKIFLAFTKTFFTKDHVDKIMLVRDIYLGEMKSIYKNVLKNNK